MKRRFGFACLLASMSMGAAARADGPTTTTSTTSTTTMTAPAPASPAPTTTAPAAAAKPSITSGEPPVGDAPMTETKSPINRALMTTGVLLLGGTYAASAVEAYASSRPEDQKYLYIPVAGPWLDLTHRDCTFTPCGNGSNENVNKALLIADGIGQGLGILGIVTSLFLPEKTTAHWLLLGQGNIEAGPSRVGTGYGLGAVGTF